MAELLLGMLAMGAVSALGPMMSNGLLSVKRPSRVDINAARRMAHTVRPIIPYRAPVPYTGGRVRALFIGINYRGTQSELRGCVNDVRSILGTLQQISFPISECCILVDDPSFPGFTGMPTRDNMIKHMLWLTSDLRPGDVLFFHFSGHGGQTKATYDSQEEYDQCLIPLDHSKTGGILDDDLFLMLVAPLPPGVRMTCVFDCCHSATMLDLPFSYVAPRMGSGGARENMQQVRRDNFSNGDVVMFSGCTDSGTSADVHNGGNANGAATLAFTWSLLNTQGFSYLNILLKTREELRRKGREQVPQLTSSKPIDLYKPFSLFGTITVNQSMMSQCVPQQYQQTAPNLPPQAMPPPAGYPAYAPPPPQGYYQQQPPQQMQQQVVTGGPGYPGPNTRAYPPPPPSQYAPPPTGYYAPPPPGPFAPPPTGYYAPPPTGPYRPPPQAPPTQYTFAPAPPR
ncbi:metacaspase [Novymonas esmeraldas]|uniref:Metacaspase n=1 Tax=Novymonas esmeraldas TaxID=1808958 RepID=A0AAW0ETX3_9TRYP